MDSGNRSGSKRVIGDDFEVADGGISEIFGKRKVRVSDGINYHCAGEEGSERGVDIFPDLPEVGGKEVEVGGAEKSNGLRELEKVGQTSFVMEENREVSFDLDVSVFDETELVASHWVVCENAGVGKESGEVINISSGESENEESAVVENYKGKGKMIEDGASYETNLGFDLQLDLNSMEVDESAGGSISGERKYTREEKGKEKVVQSWMSLGGNPMELDVITGLENQMLPAVSFLDLEVQSWMSLGGNPMELDVITGLENQMLPAVSFLDLEVPEIVQLNEAAEFELLSWQQDMEVELRSVEEAREQEGRALLELIREQDAREEELRREQRANESRQRQIDYRKRAHRRFARPLENDLYREPSENEQKLLSTALSGHREKKLKLSDQEPIRWKPSENPDRAASKRFVPSLMDLSLKGLADNADAIVSIEAVPDSLKRRLSNLICDSRKMNVKVLDLFVRGSPEEIRIKDSSWITDGEFKKSFGCFNPKNLRVFQFDLGGQCISDDTIAQTLASCSNSLPGLGIISLRGACRLSDETLKVITKLAPALCSINLGECSLVTHVGINYLANALGGSLRELFIDNCSRIDGKHIASALKNFEHLEVLSLAGIPNICDQVISDIITACGKNIKYLDLANCERLTDSSLKIIGLACSDLRALNIVNLHNLTDEGLSNLASGCKSIRSLKLCRNEFSDEAIAAFVDIAGRSLEELSLNHVRQVGSCTALSLAKFSRKLLSLDLSWCRQVTDEALGLIVDSCWSLKLLKVFGCTQITNVFLNGHSNSLVKIIGLNMSSILEHLGTLEGEEIYLQYSSLPITCGSENLDHQGV